MKQNKGLLIFFGVSMTALALYTFYFHDKYFSKQAKERIKKAKDKKEAEEFIERLKTEGVTIFEKPLFSKNEKGLYCIQPPCF